MPAAKVFETYDHEIYRALGFVSGHPLKHLAAAGGVLGPAADVQRPDATLARPSPGGEADAAVLLVDRDGESLQEGMTDVGVGEDLDEVHERTLHARRPRRG